MRGAWQALIIGSVASAVLAQGADLSGRSGPSANNASKQRDAKNWDVLHKLYPKRAIANREEGLVGFLVKIDAAGSPTECKITHTSGHRLLDQETCQLIMIHATFKRPEGLSLSQQRTYEGVVNWKLPSTPLAAVPAAPKPIAAAAAPEPVICKRIQKTGSHAAFERTCMTKREWERATAETQDHWNGVQGRKASTTEGMMTQCISPSAAASQSC